jgi:alpha-tubulin suppressor-like RCC1 family protein/subtilisin family serine protease
MRSSRSASKLVKVGVVLAVLFAAGAAIYSYRDRGHAAASQAATSVDSTRQKQTEQPTMTLAKASPASAQVSAMTSQSGVPAGSSAAVQPAAANPLPPITKPYELEPELDLEKHYVIIKGHRAHPYKLLAKYKTAEASAARTAVLDRLELREQMAYPLTPSVVVLRPRAPVITPVEDAADAEARGAVMLARIEELNRSGKFEYVEPDYIRTIDATPTDTAFTDGTLWGLRNTGQSGGVSGADIDAVRAWDTTTGSTAVLVAVIDTGIRYTHQDLTTQMWRNPDEIAGNGLDDDQDGYIDNVYGINGITNSGDPMDDQGHGTHCAGTIGAQANGGGPHVGVAWSVKLMACKFLSSSGSGSTSDAIKCINFAVAKGAHILSNSWGGGGYSQALADAITAANASDVLFVAAAGNSGSNSDLIPSYPASYTHDNIISVASIDRQDMLSYFSNYGATSVDIAAPGSNIYSCYATSDTSYYTASGTSMATPHVAGVAALVLADAPGISTADLRERILAGAIATPALSGKVVTGGRVNAHNSLTGEPDGTLEVSVAPGTGAVLTGGATLPVYVYVRDFQAVTNATVAGTAGGSTSVAFLNNGTGGDVTANDNVYTASITLPTTGTSYSLSVQVSAPGKTSVTIPNTYTLRQPPANDNFSARTTITGNATVTGHNIGATRETGEPSHHSSAGGKSVWWTWTATANGTLTIRTTGSNFDTVLAAHTGSALNTLTRLASDDDSGGGLSSLISINVVTGNDYQIAVDGYGSSSGEITLATSFVAAPLPPANDNFANSIELTGSTQTTAGNNALATKETGEPNHAGNSGGRSVWWHWTAPSAGTVTVTTDNSLFDTTLGIYVGTSVSTLTAIASDNDSGEGSRSQVSFTATAGTTYRIAVDGWNGASGSLSLALSLVLTPPAPTNDQFANRSTLTGTAATATGTTIGSTKETGEPDHAQNSGGRSIWWTWTAPTTGTVTLATTGSNFDTLLAVYTGTAVSALTEVASNNQDPVGGDTSRVMFTATAGTTYQIAVDGVSSGLNIALGNVSLSLTLSSVVLPANDFFAYRTFVTDATAVVTGSNLNATAEAGEPAHYASASKSLWWSWTAPTTRQVAINTTGSSSIPAIAVYTGTSLNALTRVASNYYGLPSASQVVFAATAGTTYQIAIDSYYSSGGNVTLNINPAMPAPVLGSPSATVTRFVGEYFSLYVSATSSTPMTFQWQKDGVNLVDGNGIYGATTQSLSFSSARSSDAGQYRLLATNVGGTTTSSASVVTITTPPAPIIITQPANRSIYLGQYFELYVGVQYAGPATYQWQRSTDAGLTFTAILGATSNYYNFYNAQAAQAGQYRVVVTNAGGTTTSQTATVTVSTPPPPVFQTQPVNRTGYLGDSISLYASVVDTGTATYQWQQSTDGGVTFTDITGATWNSLYIDNAQTRHIGQYRLAVTNAGGTTYSNVVTVALTAPPPPVFSNHPTGTTVPAGNTVYLYGRATGSGLITYQWQKDGVNLIDGGSIYGATSNYLYVYTTGTVHSGQYRLIATNAGGSVTSNAATVTVTAPPAPTISTPPSSRTVVAGTSTNFFVSASGVGLTYQWQKDGVNMVNNTRISGATTSYLQIMNTQASDAGSYRVIVSNDGGSVTSAAAVLTITVPLPPTFLAHPTDLIVLQGSQFSLSGSASGSGSVTYQWYKDNTLIPGATSSIYSKTAAVLTDAGVYKLAAINGGGTTFSNNATVTITPATAPVFVVQPQSQSVEVGDRVTFTAAAAANPAATYQWYRNGVILTGFTAPSLTLMLPAQTSENGVTYQVKATNSGGTTDSAPATLTVLAAGSGNILELAPATRTVGAGRVVYPLTVRTSGAWTATTTANWIAFSAATGTGSRTLEVTVAPNPLPTERTATITVGSRTHTITQRAAGTTIRELWATGENLFGQLGDSSLPRSMYPSQADTAVRAVSLHGNQTFYIKTDNTLWAMGANSQGQLGDGTTADRDRPVQISTGVSAVSAGALHTLILKTDGTLWATGNNTFGQLGDGTTTSRSTPVQIMTGVQSVAAGLFHSLILKTDGTLWATGANSRGQFGNGTTTSRSTPLQVATGVRAIAAGDEHTLFIKTDNSFWGAGANSSGQLASNTADRITPVHISIGNISSVMAGGDTTLCIMTDGTLMGMGDNSSGQLGTGSTYNIYSPTIVATGVSRAAISAEHTLYLKTDATLWATGENILSELGDGTAINRLRPVQITTGVSALSASYDHSAFIKPDGTLWVMGSSFNGQLGAASAAVESRRTPVSIASDVQSASAGQTHTLFVKTDGTAWSVGNNDEGQLGDGSTLARIRPAQIATSIAQVSAGASHSLLVKQDGSLLATGANTYGQLGVNSNVRRTSPLLVNTAVSSATAGHHHTLIRKTNNALQVCGANASGQLGANTTSSIFSPLTIQGSSVAAIAAGALHTFYVSSSGTLMATGSVSHGQLGNGSSGEGFYRTSMGFVMGGCSTAAAGGKHSLFLKTDRSVWVTGANDYGQLGNSSYTNRSTPTQIANACTAVAAGTDFSFILKSDGGLWGFGENYSGQLGNGRNDFAVPTPTHLAANVDSVSAGDQHTVFIATGDIRTGGYTAPVITSFSPASPTPGATVTINGNGLNNALGVYFNNVPATSYTVVSTNQITAVVPDTNLANLNITVGTFDGVANQNNATGTPPPAPAAGGGGGGGGGAHGLGYFAALAALVALRRALRKRGANHP